MPQLVYSIKLKRDTKDAVLGPHLVNRELPISSYMKVKGDRGIDLGIVVEKISLQDYRSERKRYCAPKLSQVICLAKQDEVVYLCHCYFAAKSLGDVCFDSFLDETFLVDRKTMIREYVQSHPGFLNATPPPELMERYSG
jgi:hypothetical protein